MTGPGKPVRHISFSLRDEFGASQNFDYPDNAFYRVSTNHKQGEPPYNVHELRWITPIEEPKLPAAAEAALAAEDLAHLEEN